jgi:hypothetical protein
MKRLILSTKSTKTTAWNTVYVVLINRQSFILSVGLSLVFRWSAIDIIEVAYILTIRRLH